MLLESDRQDIMLTPLLAKILTHPLRQSSKSATISFTESPFPDASDGRVGPLRHRRLSHRGPAAADRAVSSCAAAAWPTCAAGSATRRLTPSADRHAQGNYLLG